MAEFPLPTTEENAEVPMTMPPPAEQNAEILIPDSDQTDGLDETVTEPNTDRTSTDKRGYGDVSQSSNESTASPATKGRALESDIDERRLNAIIKNNIDPLLQRISALECNKVKLENDLDTLRNEHLLTVGKLNQLETDTDISNQYSRGVNLRFLGVPEEGQEESTESVVIKVCGDLLGTVIQPYEIGDCHRLGQSQSDRPRAILCQVYGRKVKKKIISAAKVVSAKLKLRAARISIVDDLTRLRADIFREGREMAKDGKISSIWTVNGNIRVRQTNDDIKRITNKAELTALRQTPENDEDIADPDIHQTANKTSFNKSRPNAIGSGAVKKDPPPSNNHYHRQTSTGYRRSNRPTTQNNNAYQPRSSGQNSRVFNPSPRYPTTEHHQSSTLFPTGTSDFNAHFPPLTPVRPPNQYGRAPSRGGPRNYAQSRPVMPGINPHYSSPAPNYNTSFGIHSYEQPLQDMQSNYHGLGYDPNFPPPDIGAVGGMSNPQHY